jgi:hypothetical protein
MELINQPVFWAAHLWNVLRGPLAGGDTEIADAAFGIPTDSIEEFYLRELSNEATWPYLHISLHAGYALEIEYANESDDHEVRYSVCREDNGSSICIGRGGGHWQLPAFRWTELIQIGLGADRSGSALLLLLPTVWITHKDNVREVRRHLTAELEMLNLVPRSQTAILAEQLITSSQSDVRWRAHERFGWINDGDNSTRNPESPASLNARQFSALVEFFNTMSV